MENEAMSGQKIIDGLRDAVAGAAIVRDPDILGGTPCIAGTRIPVRAIKCFSNAGYWIHAIMREYPTLTEEQVRAALNWEGKVVSDDLVMHLRASSHPACGPAADRIEELEAALREIGHGIRKSDSPTEYAVWAARHARAALDGTPGEPEPEKKEQKR